jgi:mannose-1-phosphate guanylyltransferase/mannose-1-phosphate guanylyltransferase/mannose-6-phosphate isomerase
MIEALGNHAPEVLAAAQAALGGAARDGRRVMPDAAAFAAAPAVSIDYAVMEKAERIAVVPAQVGWSDIGSWDALHIAADKDSDGNAVTGPGLAIGTSGCLIRSEGPLVAAIGVEDLVIVATGDAVLIVPRARAQEVKDAVEALARAGREDLL